MTLAIAVIMAAVIVGSFRLLEVLIYLRDRDRRERLERQEWARTQEEGLRVWNEFRSSRPIPLVHKKGN